MSLTHNAAMKIPRPHASTRKTPQGFSLIELMVVMAIIGIIAAIAYPSYTSSLQRGYRSSAQAALLEAQQYMERFYSANSRYTTDAAGTTAPALPARLSAIPSDSPKYDLAVSAATLNSFTLTATPRDGNTDACGNLTLTNTGVRGRSGSGTVQECWK